jgi:predicted enzyme related to lactoylglutathione lyase
MSNGSVRGRFIWHELMTNDTSGAIAFYTKVIGWSKQAWQGPMEYTMLVAKSGPVAGVMPIPEDAKAMGAPACWTTYIGTPNVDETAASATSLGARVLKEPTDIPDVGRFAVLQDPQGASFAIFTPSGEGMADGAPSLGGFSWHELATTDPDAAFDFYAALFGWEKTDAMDMGAMGVYQMYGWKGNTLGGIYRKTPGSPGPSNWLAYTLVADAKKTTEIARRAGATVINGPMEVPGGDWITVLMDPQGIAFAVHSKKPAAKAAPKAKPKKAAKKAKRPAKKAAHKKAKKPARKAKKPARKKARRPARKPARRASRKPARKPAKKRGARKKK